MSSSVVLILVSVLAYGLVQGIPISSTNPCQDVMRMLQNGQNTQEIREVLLKSASGRGYKPSYTSGNSYYNNDDDYYSGGDSYYSGNDNYYSGNDNYYSGDDDYYSGKGDNYYGGKGDDYYNDKGDDYYSGKGDDYYTDAYYSSDSYTGSYGGGNSYYAGGSTGNYYNGNSYYNSKGKGKKPKYDCAGESCRKQKPSKGKSGKSKGKNGKSKSEDGSRLVEEFLRMTGLGSDQASPSAVLQQCSQLPGAPTFGDFLQSLRNAVAPQ